MEENYLITALLVGVFCGIVGYLIGKSNKKTLTSGNQNFKNDFDVCNQKNKQLVTENESLKSELSNAYSNAKKNNLVAETTLKPKTTVVAFNAIAAKAVFGKKVKEDDLKLIEGIGPKIEELFKTSGILTWKRLSETSVDRCNKILHKAGDRYKIHDPSTWPKQAKYAYQGKWQKLKEWQDTLDKGKIK